MWGIKPMLVLESNLIMSDTERKSPDHSLDMQQKSPSMPSKHQTITNPGWQKSATAGKRSWGRKICMKANINFVWLHLASLIWQTQQGNTCLDSDLACRTTMPRSIFLAYILIDNAENVLSYWYLTAISCWQAVFMLRVYDVTSFLSVCTWGRSWHCILITLTDLF